MPYFDFAVIGGDKRLTYMIPILREKGYRVISYHISRDTTEEVEAGRKSSQAQSLKEAVSSADSIILGIPVCRGNYLNSTGNISFQELIHCLKKDQPVFGGSIKTMEEELFLTKTNRIHDFLKEEGIAIKNATATAEGVILELLKQSERMLTNEKILIFGYGRCGKCIAERIKGMMGRVSIATNQKEEAAWAKANGFQVYDLNQAKKRMNEYPCMINTIPFPFLESRDLSRLQKKTILYEIASTGCLCNEETLGEARLEIRKLPGLPGKYKAQSLAEAYTEFVCEKVEGEKER